LIIISEKKGKNGFKEVDSEYEWIAKMLFIDPVVAKSYVIPLAMAKFDKTVGELLINTDLAISMPELGKIFEDQVSLQGKL
jgi:hypothetical protein